MSSHIPTRRVTRATRLPDENAVKGRHPVTRGTAKPGATTAAGPSKPTTGGAALDANTQNKRKREALGEVTNNNKNKNVPKGISKDGKIAKPHVLITSKPTRPTVRAPARKTKASAATTSKEVEVPEEVAEEPDEDAMVVDEPAPAPPAQTLHRVTRRLLTRTSTTVTTDAATRHVTQHQKTRSVTVTGHSQAVVADVEEEDEEDEDAHRANKRRRTSEADVEAAAVETELEAEKPSADEATVHQGQPVNDAIVAPPSTVVDEDEEEEVTGWDDLDKEDWEDPSMVSEYVVDIFKYLSELEVQTLPKANYMQHQSDLRWNQRGILMDYLISLHQRFRFFPETLYLAVNIIDRFLSVRVVTVSKLQLVGLTGLFIATKFEEVMAPSVQNFLVAGGLQDETTEEEMLKAERYMLKTLNWSVSLFPQPLNWLRRISKADDYDPQVRTLAKFFLEIHVVERRLLGVKPSLIAAASIWLGRLVMHRTEWTPNLAHYSGYSQKKIIPIANIMLNYCLRPDKHENFISKYASRKYCKVGVYINDWVTQRWTLGSKISLVDELPYLEALMPEGGDQSPH